MSFARILWAAALGSMLAAPTARAASTSPAPSLDPEAQAADSYRRGVRYRDEALALEAEAVEATEASRLEAKARKEFEKAARAFRSAVEADPSLVPAHTELGFVLRRLGEYEESLAAYEQALVLEPGYAPAIEYQAEAYLGLGRLEEVKAAYLQLFSSERGHADQLMDAMQHWVEGRRTAPGDLAPAVIDEFAAWVAERDALARQAADLAVGQSTQSW